MSTHTHPQTLPRLETANADFVTPYLVVGGDLSYDDDTAVRQSVELVVAGGVTHVLDVRQEADDAGWWAETEVTYLWAGIDDAGQRVPAAWFERIVTWATAAIDGGGVVLAHCHMGINRGPSAGYALLLGMGWDPVEALVAIRAARPIAHIWYAEDALRWHFDRVGATPAQRRTALARVRASGVKRTRSTSSASSVASGRARAIDSDPGSTISSPSTTQEASMNVRIALSLKPDFPNARWAWSLAGEGFGTIGSVAAHGREDAVLCAVAQAYDRLRARGPVELVVSLPPTARLWSCAAEISTHFVGVTFVPYTDADASIRSVAMQALNPVELVVAPPTGSLTVATDGSATRGRIGWGWLAEDGRHGQGTETPSIRSCVRRRHPVLAELRAISEAMTALPHRDLAIRTDCRQAIALVEEWIGGGQRLPDGYVATHHTAVKRGGLLWMQGQVRQESHRLDISWVRGHAGDPLNEGADSLSKLARRGAEGTWGFTVDDVPQRAREIADAFTTTHHTTRSATAA